MKMIITGVTSFLGLYTAEQMLSEGHDVIGVVRPGSRHLGKLDRFLHGKEGTDSAAAARRGSFSPAYVDFDRLPEADEAKYRAARNAVRASVLSEELQDDAAGQKEADSTSSATADVWIHFAWDVIGSAGRQDEAMQERNIRNARKAYMMAQALGCRKFLFAGSQAEYGTGSKKKPEPVSAYGKAKLAFGKWGLEQCLLSSILFGMRQIEFLHLRIYSVYGSGDHETSLISTLLRMAGTGEDMVLGPCTQKWNYLEVRDFARAIYLLATDPEAGTEVYDVAGTETRPLRSFVEEAWRLAGGKGQLRFGIRPDNAEGAVDMNPDTSRLRSFRFREKIPFRDGIRDLLLEMQKQMLMPPAGTQAAEKAARKRIRRKCLACGGGMTALWTLDNMPASAQELPDAEGLQKEKPLSLTLCQCRRCGLVQFDTRPVSYYRSVIRAGGGSSTMHALRHTEYRRLLEAMEQTGMEGRRIVEIGCGRGEFLRMWRDLPEAADVPLRTAGIEYDPALVRAGEEDGLEVYRGFAEPGFVIPGGPYDAFVQFNFLEHQPDPRGMLCCIRDNLAEGGMGLLTVPSFEYILANDGYYELLRDHIANYTEETLGALLRSCGFRVLGCRIVNRDTIEMIVQKTWDADGPAAAAVSAAENAGASGTGGAGGSERSQPGRTEQRLPLLDIGRLKENYVRLKAEVNAYLSMLSSEGRTLAIWGASHQGFTLAATTELSGKVQYFIDSAPFKQGRYAPGSHIPVVPPVHFREEPVDEILIAAPGYTDEIAGIIKKELAPWYLDRTGHELRILALRSERIETLE